MISIKVLEPSSVPKGKMFLIWYIVRQEHVKTNTFILTTNIEDGLTPLYGIHFLFYSKFTFLIYKES